jgi:hypothetical protein
VTAVPVVLRVLAVGLVAGVLSALLSPLVPGPVGTGIAVGVALGGAKALEDRQRGWTVAFPALGMAIVSGVTVWLTLRWLAG